MKAAASFRMSLSKGRTRLFKNSAGVKLPSYQELRRPICLLEAQHESAGFFRGKRSLGDFCVQGHMFTFTRRALKALSMSSLSSRTMDSMRWSSINKRIRLTSISLIINTLSRLWPKWYSSFVQDCLRSFSNHCCNIPYAEVKDCPSPVAADIMMMEQHAPDALNGKLGSSSEKYARR